MRLKKNLINLGTYHLQLRN